jgi:hypothetical protein
LAVFAGVPRLAASTALRTLLLFKNSVRTAKKTPHFTITKINWLTLFKEIIAAYTENHTKQKMQTYILSSMWHKFLPLGFKKVYIKSVTFSSEVIKVINSYFTKTRPMQVVNSIK